jgi:hypothetical protein
MKNESIKKNETIKNIETIIDGLEEGTLKQAKTDFIMNTKADIISYGVLGTLDLSDKATTCRTKKAFIQCLKSIIYFLSEAVKLEKDINTINNGVIALDDIRKEGLKEKEEEVKKEEVKKESSDEPVKKQSLTQLSKKIKRELEKAQKSFLTVGECLTTALNQMKEEGKKQSDFIAWANETCGIKKAQAYKLMKVYKEFGNNSDFSGVSMRVLYTLTGQPSEVVEEARKQALDGTLDTKALDKIIMSFERPAPVPASKSAPVSGSSDNDSEKPAEASKSDDSGDSESLPDTTAKDEEIERLRAELEAEKSKPSETPESNYTADEITILNDTIAELRKTVESLNKQLEAEREKNSKPSISVPYLPQFDSPFFCVRLGIAKEEVNDKAKVNKAYRALAKIYTAATNKKAADQLKEARENLLVAAK